MTPYQEPNLLKEIIYVLIWFIWAFISIMYWILGWKKITIRSSLIMILIWWFVGWLTWWLTDNNLVAWICWAMSLEIMHIIKEIWPDIIKQKIKDFFKIK